MCWGGSGNDRHPFINKGGCSTDKDGELDYLANRKEPIRELIKELVKIN